MIRMLVLTMAFLAGAAGLGADGYDPAAGPSGVQVTTPAGSAEARSLVEAMGDYRLQNDILWSLEAARNWHRDRVRYEFHLGGGMLLPQTYESIQAGTPAWRLSSGADLRPTYLAGLKVNFGNLKMVAPERTLSALARLRHLLALRRYPFTDAALAEVAQMEASTKAYLDQFWWKRLSLMISYPFLYRTDRGFTSYVYTIGTSTYYSSSNYYDTTPGFGYHQTVLSLGYDLGDLATLSLGYSINNAFALGVSIDVSTPVYSFGENFFNMLRAWAGTPNTSPYQSNYYSRY